MVIPRNFSRDEQVGHDVTSVGLSFHKDHGLPMPPIQLVFSQEPAQHLIHPVNVDTAVELDPCCVLNPADVGANGHEKVVLQEEEPAGFLDALGEGPGKEQHTGFLGDIVPVPLAFPEDPPSPASAPTFF